jgi:hypothetical protein
MSTCPECGRELTCWCRRCHYCEDVTDDRYDYEDDDE